MKDSHRTAWSHQLQHVRILRKILFIHFLERQREREFLQFVYSPNAGKTKAGIWALHLGLLHEWQALNYLDHFHCFSRLALEGCLTQVPMVDILMQDLAP